jgi:hypothetical protein
MLFSQIKNPEPALLPALNAALAALEKTGGKIVCSLSALPTWGPGRLFLRDDGKQISGDAEKKLFTTEHPGWRKTAEKMVAAGVGSDFFLAAPGGGYLDIATIGELAKFSEEEFTNTFKAMYLLPPEARPFTIRILFLQEIMKSCASRYCIPSNERPDIKRY